MTYHRINVKATSRYTEKPFAYIFRLKPYYKTQYYMDCISSEVSDYYWLIKVHKNMYAWELISTIPNTYSPIDGSYIKRWDAYKTIDNAVKTKHYGFWNTNTPIEKFMKRIAKKIVNLEKSLDIETIYQQILGKYRLTILGNV